MHRFLCAVVAASVVVVAPARAQANGSAPQPAKAVDWNALSDEAIRTLSDYLKVNTTNPPGNEMQGILFLKKILEREGFEVQVLDTGELGATRGNLYARLKGNGSKK